MNKYLTTLQRVECEKMGLRCNRLQGEQCKTCED